MALKFMIRVKKPNPERSVKFLLHKHFGGVEPERGMATVHASELTKVEGFCPRAYTLVDLTKSKPGTRWLSTSERLTFALGNAMQIMVMSAFGDMGQGVCHWRCLGCNQLHQFQKRPCACDKCGGKRFHPVEVRFTSKVTGVSCGVDMLVSFGDGKLLPVELKTMAADAFKALQAPLAEHRLRTNLYLRILAEAEEPWGSLVDQTRAAILYISKAAYGCKDDSLKPLGIKEGFSPFKEFWIDRDDTQTDALCIEAARVKAFRAGETGVPEGICPTAVCKRAEKCIVKKACFSGDYPAGMKVVAHD